MEKILVVNNDLDTMTLLKGWLERKKYKVEFTGESEEVPALIRKLRPKLLIVDVLREDVVDQVKNNEETKEIPVLLMTGYTMRKKTPEIKADDVIEKPFNLDLLEKKIAKLIA